MTVTDDELLDLLNAADPIGPAAVHGGASVDDPTRLAQVRRVVDARREQQPWSRPHRRLDRLQRWRVAAMVTAAVVATPVGLLASLPGIASRLGLPWATSVAVIGSELADRECDSGGHSSAIAPSDASMRLWPSELPAGWAPETVFARDIDKSHRGCLLPSLVLADLGADRTVNGLIRVVGPRQAFRYQGDITTSPDQLAGLSAKMISYDPSFQDPAFHRWVVTGPGGSLWEVAAIGISVAETRRTLAKAQFTRRSVSYAEGADPSMSVLYRREGPPFQLTTSGTLEWYVYFRDEQDRERHLFVWRSAPAVPLTADEYGPGAQLLDVDGRPAILDPRNLTVEVRPGVLASMEVAGDLPAVQGLLSDLVDLNRDDPRLRRYALDEKYSD